MKLMTIVSALVTMLPIATQSAAQQYIFRSIGVSCPPSATACPAGLAPGATAAQTVAKDVNASGDIVGLYLDTAGRQHGFLLRQGVFSSIDFPVAGVRATVVNGINAQSEMVGTYLAPVNTDPNIAQDSPQYCPAPADAACTKGFYYGDGTFETVLYSGHPGSVPEHITDDGDIYGCLHDRDTGMSMFGAVWTRSFGPRHSAVITSRMSLRYGDGEVTDPDQLVDTMGVPMSMNNAGSPGGGQTIAGFFVDGGRTRGYLVQSGTLYPYDVSENASLTAIWALNANQQFAGTYRNSGEPLTKRHGFLQNADGAAPYTFDFSFIDEGGNTITAYSTIAYGLSPAAVIVGQYALVAGGPLHGFVAIPVDGN